MSINKQVRTQNDGAALDSRSSLGTCTYCLATSLPPRPLTYDPVSNPIHFRKAIMLGARLGLNISKIGLKAHVEFVFSE